MNTLMATVVRAWNNWEVRLWPDRETAEEYIRRMYDGGLDEGLQRWAVLPYETELPVPTSWPVCTRGFFEDPSTNPLIEELTAASRSLIQEADRVAETRGKRL